MSFSQLNVVFGGSLARSDDSAIFCNSVWVCGTLRMNAGGVGTIGLFPFPFFFPYRKM